MSEVKGNKNFSNRLTVLSASVALVTDSLGASTFDDLTDTPANKTGKAGQVPVVNTGETALEFSRSIEAGRAIFVDNQWGYWSADSSSNTLDGLGLLGNLTALDNASSQDTTIDGIGLQQDTTSASGNDVSVRSDFDVCALGMIPHAIIKWQLKQTTDFRLYSGLTSITFSLAFASNDIGDGSVGIQFSAPRADTNFQFLAHDGTTQTLVDSGIAVDTAIHFTKIEAASASSVTVSLLDKDFVSLASTTFTTELPGAAQGLQLISGLRNTGAAVKSLTQFYATLLLRNS